MVADLNKCKPQENDNIFSISATVLIYAGLIEMPLPLHDTSYLKDTVGDALSRACAACIEVQPLDPVEFTARWLLRYLSGPRHVGHVFVMFASTK